MAQALPEAYRNGDNLEARAAMGWAVTLSGVSISTQGVLIPHQFSMVMGGRYGVNHARGIAAVMVVCLKQLRPGAVAKLANVARLMGCTENFNNEDLADWAIDAVSRLIDTLELPQSPSVYGVPLEASESMAAEVMAVFPYRVKANPVPTSVEDMAQMFRDAILRGNGK
jgi:alcohol dehydrogenase